MLQKLKVTSYALIILLLLLLPSQVVAFCLTPTACSAAAQAKGLKLGGNGYAFSSGSYKTKGCYSYNAGKYKGMAFFGTGGSLNRGDNVTKGVEAPKYRISSCPKGKGDGERAANASPLRYTSTYTPKIAVGPHLHRAMSTGGGNGDYILYGRDKTQDWCQRLLFQSSDLRLGEDVIHIQYSKKFCYYYGAVTAGAKNAGVGGPHIWTYKPTALAKAEADCMRWVDTHPNSGYVRLGPLRGSSPEAQQVRAQGRQYCQNSKATPIIGQARHSRR